MLPASALGVVGSCRGGNFLAAFVVPLSSVELRPFFLAHQEKLSKGGEIYPVF